MSTLIKNRDLILSIRELNPVNGEYENEISRTTFFAKTISYDFMAKGVETFGLKKANTLQWYSSEINFVIAGDSYVSPFLIPSPINSDDSIKNLYSLFMERFYEKSFELYKYKFFLEIKNCPLGVNLFKGIITDFKCDESDDRLGLLNFNISFTGKPEQHDKTTQAVNGYEKDMELL